VAATADATRSDVFMIASDGGPADRFRQDCSANASRVTQTSVPVGRFRRKCRPRMVSMHLIYRQTG
jgi:hypothetical protein